jgi:hypothetical protein
MKLYNIGSNNYWHTASIFLDDVPVGLHFLENVVSYICDIIPYIPLPKIKFRLKDKEAWDITENKDGRTDLNEWCGDMQQLFHIYICSPISDFVFRHTKHTAINLPYSFLKELFPDSFKEQDYEFDPEDTEHMQKTKELADWLDVQFRNLYKKLNHNYIKDSLE